jgi:hypothetical protein
VGLFIFYMVQLVYYRNTLRHHNDTLYSNYILSLDILMLLISILALVLSWLHEQLFSKVIVLFDSLLFGLSVGWLMMGVVYLDKYM